MHYRDFVRTIRLFYEEVDEVDFPQIPYSEDYEDQSYLKALKQRNADVIYSFLRKWRVRARFSVDELQQVIKHNRDIVNRLNKFHLYEVNLRFIKNDILYVFNEFSKVVRYTGASKVLHILAPNLFVMWDNTIRESYGYAKNDKGYYNFLTKMQEELMELIESYAKDYKCSYSTAVKQLCEKLFKKGCIPITRLIDVYNWFNVHRKN